jgi:hypothetical protein
MGLFDEPAAHRVNDPVTSRNAKKFNLNKDRVLALETHAQYFTGLTDYELAHHTGKQQNSIGKRRGELRDHGYVVQTTIQRDAPSGSKCLVWRITAEGLALARDIREMREKRAKQGLSLDYGSIPGLGKPRK